MGKTPGRELLSSSHRSSSVPLAVTPGGVGEHSIGRRFGPASLETAGKGGEEVISVRQDNLTPRAKGLPPRWDARSESRRLASPHRPCVVDRAGCVFCPVTLDR